jgi:hypothetical protein
MKVLFFKYIYILLIGLNLPTVPMRKIMLEVDLNLLQRLK